MNEFQGAVGLAQFRKLDGNIGEQRKNKAFLRECLGKIPGVTFRRLPDPAGDTATFLGSTCPREGDEGLPGGAEGGGDRRGLFQGEFLALRAQLGASHRVVHRQLAEIPLHEPAVPGKAEYRRETIPGAEAILDRTLFLSIPVRMPQERKETLARGSNGGEKGVGTRPCSSSREGRDSSAAPSSGN
jgi:8-amino-3,8-dideoxy-alpha-D-manno-octulosonate transaminase